MKNSNKHSFFLKEVDPEEVHKLLLKINTKKSSDIFRISPKLIKLSAEFIKGHLSFIFNEFFTEAVVPEKLYPKIVHPIHKGDSSMICANYRPMSILSILSKIPEKLVHKRLINHLDKFELLQLLKLLNKEKVCSILLNFSKAFDTVNHKILLKKLEY